MAGTILIAAVGERLPAWGGQTLAATEEKPEVGFLAPDFVLPGMDGKTVRLSDYRGKKAVFLNFWATWCPSCQYEMPTMEAAYRRFRDKGFEMLAVSINKGFGAEVAAFMKKHGLTFPALHDPKMAIMDRYEVVFIPTHFYIDREGRIRAKEIGPKDWSKPESWKPIEDLLEETSGRGR